MPTFPHDVQQAISDNYWLHDLNALRAFVANRRKASGDMRAVLNAVSQQLDTGRIGRAMNFIALGIVMEPDGFFQRLRRDGILRPSKRDFASHHAGDLVDEMISNRTILGLSTDIYEYLLDMKDLIKVAESVREHLVLVDKAVQYGGDQYMKGSLASLEFLFMSGHQRNPDKSPGEYSFYSKEQLAEGFSYVSSRFRKVVGPLKNIGMNAEEAARGDYLTPLVAGAAIREFMGIETLVECFGYHFRFRENHIAELRAADAALEKASRLGFIANEFQQQAFFYAVQFKEHPSLMELAHLFYKRAGDLAIQRLEKPIPRYVLAFPDSPEFLAFLKDARFYREELRALAFARKEMMAESIQHVADYTIADNITVADLLHVQRLFLFAGVILQDFFTPRIEKERGLILQSILPAYSTASLNKILSLVLPVEKIPAMVRLMTWDGNRVFDVQYQPFVEISEGHFIPANITYMSDVIRNSFVQARLRIYADGTIDPIADLLDAEFAAHTAHHTKSWEYTFGGEDGEVDSLALFGSILFVGEGKLLPLPTSSHELRGTWEHIEKAVFQLDKFRRLFNEEAFRQMVARKLGAAFPADLKIATCIILSNRMFTGYRFSGHPVRGAYELANFLRTGQITLRGEEIKLWQSAKLQPDDLEKYLAGGPAHIEPLENLKPVIEHLYFKPYTIEQHTFRLEIRPFPKSADTEEPSSA